MDWRRVVGGIGRACIACGLLILLFVAYQLWGTGLTEARHQDQLRADFLDSLERPGGSEGSDDDDGEGADQGPTTTAALARPDGEAVALIRIPKIGVEKAVVEGVSVGALKAGPGHYPATPMPGQPGNAAIAGHRTTYGAPFYRLDELEDGDRIDVTTRQGSFTYRVTKTAVVNPDQNEVLLPTDDNRLTLTTCHPRFSAAQRLIVIGTLVEDPAEAPPAPPVTVPAEEPSDEGEPAEAPEPERAVLDESLSGDPAARLPALLWGSAAALVWLVTWAFSKRWGRLTAYALGAPVFFVVLFIFFENVARLLPANI